MVVGGLSNDRCVVSVFVWRNRKCNGKHSVA
jgi:hypothetical protein